MGGFVRLSRNYFEHSFWKEKRVFSPAEAWLDLIRSARFETEPEKQLVKMKTIVINRGELRASQRFLADRWCWSIGKVNRFMKLLQTETMIKRRNEHNETIVTILNYNKFNPTEIEQMNTNGNTNEHSSNNTNGTPTDTLSEHPQIQTKEYKERNKNIKEYLFPREKFFNDILEIFYFKNWAKPWLVTETFFNHYEKTGWKDANGREIENIKAAARNWENHTTEGKNCSEVILNNWQIAFTLIKVKSPDYYLLLYVRLIFRKTDNTIIIKGSKDILDKIESNVTLKAVVNNELKVAFSKNQQYIREVDESMVHVT